MSKILVKAQQQPVYNLNGSGTTGLAYVLRPVRYTTMGSEDIVNYCVANSVVPKAYMSASMVALSQCIKNFLPWLLLFLCAGFFLLKKRFGWPP